MEETEVKEGEVEGKRCAFTKFKTKIPCKYFVTRDNTIYCNYHAFLDTDDFVLCPIDPSHSVGKSKLESHVKKCNRTKDNKKLEESEWFKKDLNVVDPSHNPNTVNIPKNLKAFSAEETEAWIKRINDVFESVKDDIVSMVDSDKSDSEKLAVLGVVDLEEAKLPMAEEGAPEDEELTKTTKHTFQHSAIVDMMDSYGLLLDNDVRYLEYGAGKGLLSHFLHERIDQRESNSEEKGKDHNVGFYLVEKDKIRYLKDRFHKSEENHKRIRVDISHFDISHIYKENSVNSTKLESCKEESEDERILTKPIRVIGIAKHLCGGATDLAIHSLTQSSLTYGVIIATCCHHRCDLRTYVNTPFLNKLGFEKEHEKYWLFKTTSWATSGAFKVHNTDENKTVTDLSLLKTITGYKAKRILELGRSIILKEKLGLNVKLKQYCSKKESVENMLLIGIRE